MNLPEYNVNPKAEGSWTAVSIAVGALAAAVADALGADPALSGAIAGAAGAITRWLIGHFLPTGSA